MQDKLGLILKVGDSVVFSTHNDSSVYIGRIIGITPKKIRVDTEGWSVLKDPEEVVKLEVPNA